MSSEILPTSTDISSDSDTAEVMVNMFSSVFLWAASQLSYLAVLAETGAEYPVSSSTTGVVLLISFCMVYCLCCSKKPPRRTVSKMGTDLVEEVSFSTRPMRKRDIVRHLGRRVIRRVSGSRLADLKRRSSDLRFQPPPGSSEIQLHKEPPAAFLEADLDLDNQIPHDVMYLLKSVRVFGHFEKPLFMEICKHVETKFVPSGAILFRPGQVDDSIYVVQNGKLQVFLVEQDGTELPLKEAGTGDSVHSLLSLMDSIISQSGTFNSVSARAVRDTYVLQIRAKSFKQFFEENPDSLLRIVQIIMLRLQRVTFLALNQFLGLGHELIVQKVPLPTDLNIHKLKRRPLSRSHVHPHLEVNTDPSLLNLPSEKTNDGFNVGGSGDSEDSEGGMGDEGSDRNTHSDDVSTSVDSTSSCTIAVTQDSTKSDSGDDHLHSHTSKRNKTVAIDTSHNEQFTRRLLPAQSPEFDNVINQARVDRMEFGGSLPVKANLTQNVPLTYSHFVSLEGSEILEAATQDLVKIFQLKDDSLLKGRIQLIEVNANSVLGHEGDLDSCVYFIVSGRLKVFRQSSNHSPVEDLLYVAQPSEFVGVLSALTGEPSFITIKASAYCHLIAITKTNLYQILSEHPIAVCGIAADLVRRLSPFVHQVDFALDWMDLEAGKALYRQGDESNIAYIILNGRLRSVVKNSDGKKKLVDEYGRGETVGVVEVMTKSCRATTVHAIRDTELACLPVGLLNAIKVKKPQVVSRLIQLLGERILGSYNRLSSSNIPSTEGVGVFSKNIVSNLSTIAVVPMTPDIPLSHFTRLLTSAINSIVPASRLTSSLIQEELGTSALESVHEYRLITWLGHQEDTHRLVLYQADRSLTPWTARCIRQADCILLLGIAEKFPTSESMGKIVVEVERISVRVRKELVLLHKEDVSHPTGTVKWLNALGWLSSYFHVRCPNSYFLEPTTSSEEKSLPKAPNKHSDFSRLARRLTGTSVGLVLGGGGARGLSHCGMIKAFSEAGIPIDMVGGTSIGAFVGALYCEDCDSEKVSGRARSFSMKMAGYMDKILDLTWPTTSMFTGRSFNRLIYSVFGERQIEDLWIPYFCVTTDITESMMRVHTSGCLWRYVRSSMSLSGYMPPLCDPVDGHLLLDGGYVNNLPADLMAARGAETIIAIDVGSPVNNDLTNYGDDISGFALLWNRLNPFAKKMKIPTLTEIQSRLAYVSCVRQLEAVKSDLSCEYIRPPTENIATLQFGSFDEVFRIGYSHCKTVLSGWTKSHVLSHLLSSSVEKRHRMKSSHTMLEHESGLHVRVSSIHDLAALAAEIPIRRPEGDEQVDNNDKEDEDEDDDMTGYWSNPEGNVFLSEEVDSDPEKTKKGVFSQTAYSDSELQ